MVSLHLDAPGSRISRPSQLASNFRQAKYSATFTTEPRDDLEEDIDRHRPDAMVRDFIPTEPWPTHAIRPPALGTRVCDPRKLGPSQQQEANDYLQTENRVLKEFIGEETGSAQ